MNVQQIGLPRVALISLAMLRAPLRSMNAFDLISLAGAFDLSPMLQTENRGSRQPGSVWPGEGDHTILSHLSCIYSRQAACRVLTMSPPTFPDRTLFTTSASTSVIKVRVPQVLSEFGGQTEGFDQQFKVHPRTLPATLFRCRARLLFLLRSLNSIRSLRRGGVNCFLGCVCLCWWFCYDPRPEAFLVAVLQDTND